MNFLFPLIFMMVITICWWIQVQLGLFCYFLCSIASILNEILFLSFSYIWICLPLYFILQWLGSCWNYISSSLIEYLFYCSISDNIYQTYQLLRFHIHAFYIHWLTWIFSWCVFGVLLHILPFSHWKSNILSALSMLQQIRKLQQTLGKLRLHLQVCATCFEYLSN